MYQISCVPTCVFSDPNVRSTTPPDADDHVADHVQTGRDHHAADRVDRAQPEGRHDRRDLAHVGRDQRRGQTVQVPGPSSVRAVLRASVPLRHVRPFVPTAAATGAGQEHPRARAHRAGGATAVQRYAGRVLRRAGGGAPGDRRQRCRSVLLEPRRRRTLRCGGDRR